jgi:asparagine synthase (glutamine-hydrolysing)
MLPEDVLYRKKMGFSVPLAHWLRHEIRDLAEGIFSDDNGGLAECFDMHKVRQLWRNHLNGQEQNTQELWSMLNFELWWQAYRG